jgi:hypothetical protein
VTVINRGGGRVWGFTSTLHPPMKFNQDNVAAGRWLQ